MESSKRLTVGEIKGEVNDIEMKVKILSISKREAEGSKGPITYHYGLLGDETGVMAYTAWALPSTIRELDVYDITKCYTKSYKDKLRVYFDNRTEFKFLNEPLEVKRVYKFYNLKDLNMSDKFVTVEGVLESEAKREYEKDGVKKAVFQYVLHDSKSSIALSSFGRQLKNGKYAKIEGARLDEFNGYYRLNISDKANVEYPEIELPKSSPISYISDVKSPIGGITITGFALNIGEKSGLFAKCSQCNQRVDDIRCYDHPESPLIYDIFAYFTVDDGTDFIQVSAGLDALGELAGITKEFLNDPKKPPLKREIKEKISTNIMHHALRISGNLRNGNNGLTLRSTQIKIIQKEDIVELNQIKSGEEF